MPRRTRVVTHSLRFSGWILALACVPAPALAWSEAPLCAIRPADVHEDESLAADESLDPELECAPQHGSVLFTETPWSAPISAAEARESLSHADELTANDKLDDALIALRVVEHAMPRIRDRIALRRAAILLRLGRPAEACDAYAVAEESPERNVAAVARIAMVRCMLQAGQHRGENELDRIVQRYPNMGERSELRLELARAREAWHDVDGAIVIYRNIDLNEPESAAAEDARGALARLRDAGANVHAYTAAESLGRAERLFQRGPIDAAHAAVDQLLANELQPALLGRAHLLSARIARVEGRFDVVRSEVAVATQQGVPSADAERLLPRGAGAEADADPAARALEGEARVKRMLAGRNVSRLQGGQLRGLLDLAVQYQLSDRATEILQALRTRNSFPAGARFEAAILGFGLASDQSVADVLEGVMAVRGYTLAARYHHARALERMGRFGEAEADYLRVLREDTVSPRYYAMWADLRLWSMQSEQTKTCAPEAAPTDSAGGAAADAALGKAVDDALAALPTRDARDAADATGVKHAQGAETRATADSVAADDGEALETSIDAEALARKATEEKNAARRERVLLPLGKVAADYGRAYPWFSRAADLVELDQFDDAADEIGEAYLAWRDARGDLRLRSGLEAVLTGSAPARHPVDNELRKQRRSLDMSARAALGTVADELGDPGVALRFFGVRGELRPRAYEGAVDKAAAKYSVDPNLLFAVMRVESIYHRQIVSYAGAVGLMQIMPRTGMLIARKLGVEHFDVSDLLDPGTNVEFAAWYLSSLIKRFDGSVPLAIAAYNGGPHNVRLWMRENHAGMPLDVFLERIPFSQTHEYVRRVLTHYAAYRAQQNLPMTRIDVTLPGGHPDTMAF